MSLLHQSNISTSFWRNDDIIISSVCWDQILTIYVKGCFEQISKFIYISRHADWAGSWNPSPWRHIYFMFPNMNSSWQGLKIQLIGHKNCKASKLISLSTCCYSLLKMLSHVFNIHSWKLEAETYSIMINFKQNTSWPCGYCWFSISKMTHQSQ